MKRELVMIENGKEVARVNLNQDLYVVLNDNETFSPAKGSSIWQDKASDMIDTSDCEQTFKGNQKTKGLKKLMEL